MGSLSWTAKHFSDYVVVSGEQKILVKETNGSLKYYGTLTDAITNAGENAVITLLDNLFEKGIFLGAGTKQFTVDFAGLYLYRNFFGGFHWHRKPGVPFGEGKHSCPKNGGDHSC